MLRSAVPDPGLPGHLVFIAQDHVKWVAVQVLATARMHAHPRIPAVDGLVANLG